MKKLNIFDLMYSRWNIKQQWSDTVKISTLLKTMGCAFIGLGVLTFVSIYYLYQSFDKERATVSRQAEFKQLGNDLMNASDKMTEDIRRYVQFGEQAYYDSYWKEVNETKTRDHVIERLKQLNAPKSELDLIEEAKANSDVLVKIEVQAMQAVKDGDFEKARKLTYDSNYDARKAVITKPMMDFETKMNARAASEAEAARNAASNMLMVTVVLVGLLSVSLFSSVIIIYRKLIPLKAVNEKLEELGNNKGFLSFSDLHNW